MLLLVAPLNTAAFLAALRSRMATGERTAALALSHALLPAWVAELSCTALGADGSPDERRLVVEELAIDLQAAAHGLLSSIVALGRIAGPLAFAIAIVHMGLAFRHETGLLALQRGLPQTIAVERAVLSIVTGMATSLVCHVSVALLRKHVVTLQRDVRVAAEVLLGFDGVASP